MAIVVGPGEGTDQIWTILVVSRRRVEPTGGGKASHLQSTQWIHLYIDMLMICTWTLYYIRICPYTYVCKYVHRHTVESLSLPKPNPFIRTRHTPHRVGGDAPHMG